MENIIEIKIKYNAINTSELKIFGDIFVENNKDKCKMIINNREEELNTFYDFGNEEDEEEFKELIK